MRLLHAQMPMQDDQKLCEYSLPEGATINALFEPDVDINIEVSTHYQMQKLTVSDATLVNALKVKICGITRNVTAPGNLKVRFGNITLKDPVPLHFYGIVDGSKIENIWPYLNVMVETNFGQSIC